MLEEHAKPPWAARTVLYIINSHSTTFWGGLGASSANACDAPSCLSLLLPCPLLLCS